MLKLDQVEAFFPGEGVQAVHEGDLVDVPIDERSHEIRAPGAERAPENPEWPLAQQAAAEVPDGLISAADGPEPWDHPLALGEVVQPGATMEQLAGDRAARERIFEVVFDGLRPR